LSVEYDLVHPDEMIEPYDMTLNTMGVAERRNWSRRVQQQMDERMPDASRIVVLAGQRYREFLLDYLGKRAATVLSHGRHTERAAVESARKAYR
jgi:hypothetical protein